MNSSQIVSRETINYLGKLYKKSEVTKELWYRAKLKWKLHKGQRKIYEAITNATKQLFVLNCSRQFGKSYLLACIAVEHAIKNPKARIKYGSPFQTDLGEFIIPAFNKVLEDSPSGLRPVFKKSGYKYVFPNGSEIKLVGLDKNPNSLRGNTIDLIIVDECGFVSNLDYIYKSVIVPATTHRPNCKIILSSTPPESPVHDFIDYARKAELEGGYAVFTIYDNPMLNEQQIRRLADECGGFDSITFRREYLCEFVTDSALQIVPEWLDSFCQVVPRDDFYSYYHKYSALDIGVRHLTACVFGYWDFKQAKLIIEDEWDLHGAEVLTRNIYQKTLDTEKKLWGDKKPYRRMADSNNLILLQDLGVEYDMHFAPTSKDTIEAMVNELRLMVGRGQIIIDPKCKKTIGAIKYGVWDENKRKNLFAESKVYGHFDHLAALIYLVRNIDKSSNPIPVTHGMSIHTHHIGEMSEQSANAKQFSKIFNIKGPRK